MSQMMIDRGYQPLGQMAPEEAERLRQLAQRQQFRVAALEVALRIGCYTDAESLIRGAEKIESYLKGNTP